MRNYVNFRGRARRREFWMFTLFNTLVYLLPLAVGLVLLGAVIYKSVAEGGDAAEHATAYTLAVAGLLLLVYGWMLATFLPGLAVRALALLSAAGIAAMCIGSEKGENRYGADPTAEIPAADAGDAECVTDRLT